MTVLSKKVDQKIGKLSRKYKVTWVESIEDPKSSGWYTGNKIAINPNLCDTEEFYVSVFCHELGHHLLESTGGSTYQATDVGYDYKEELLVELIGEEICKKYFKDITYISVYPHKLLNTLKIDTPKLYKLLTN